LETSKRSSSGGAEGVHLFTIGQSKTQSNSKTVQPFPHKKSAQVEPPPTLGTSRAPCVKDLLSLIICAEDSNLRNVPSRMKKNVHPPGDMVSWLINVHFITETSGNFVSKTTHFLIRNKLPVE
jgi:hypothetical protein